jgi:hypothetical protein
MKIKFFFQSNYKILLKCYNNCYKNYEDKNLEELILKSIEKMKILDLKLEEYKSPKKNIRLFDDLYENARDASQITFDYYTSKKKIINDEKEKNLFIKTYHNNLTKLKNDMV